jgi:predicted DNA-binding transcriptional regulator
LRLELKKENILVYSYYIDLADSIGEEDIQKGFDVIKNTLPLRVHKVTN